MKRQFDVKGMTCASCSSRVEKVVGKMDGVNDVVVNLATEKMTVDFDQDKVSVDQIEEKVKKAGYEATEIKSDDIVEKNYNITGMTCASCSSRIEKILNKADGVESAVVNLATEKATVKFDKSVISSEDIIKKVEKAGYGAEEIDEGNKSEAHFKVKGMTCASCSNRVEKVVNRMDGVYEAVVNLALEDMNVKYDKRKVSIEDIEKVVKNAGYEAIEIKDTAKSDHKKDSQEKVK